MFRRRLDAKQRKIERWFGARGLTLMLRGTEVGGGTSVRAVPAMVIAFIFAMVGVVPGITDYDWLSTLITSVVLIVVVWVGANLLRKRRPFAPVRQFGVIEGLAFVLAPVLAIGAAPQLDDVVAELGESPWILRLTAMAIVAAWQLLVLSTILLAVTFGLVSLFAWLWRSLLRSFSSAGSGLATTLPVMLGVVLFTFFSPGLWVTVGRLTVPSFTAAVLLLLVLAGAFLGSRRQVDVEGLSRFEDTEQLREALQETPLADEPVTLSEPTVCPVDARQETSIRLVAIISRLVVAVVIAAGVFLFLVVLGFLVVDFDALKGWIRIDPGVLIRSSGDKHTYILSFEHLRVAGFLATFAAFNFSLASASDARLRHDTRQEAEEVVRKACAVRLALLLRLAKPDQPQPGAAQAP